MKWKAPIAVAALVLLGTTGAALADVIDGDWCAADGRHMSIRGPSIVTPGGSQISGLYSRHAFSYVVPAPERSAGSTIIMRLVNPETIDLWAGGTPVGPAEIWKRCTPVSALAISPIG